MTDTISIPVKHYTGGYVSSESMTVPSIFANGCTITALKPAPVDTSKYLTELEIQVLRGLQAKLYNAAVVAGWHDVERDFPTGIALIHSEISEAFEGFRKDNKQDDHLPHRKNAEVELADALIRILDECGLRKMDIAGAVAEKFAYNQVRLDHKRENRAKEGGKKF
jgi:NTP pyrophosphatase (non-canonical NTP hydrolase)